MNLRELLIAVKDENLPLQMIEKYRDEMVHLHSEMQMQLAEVEKEEAVFIASCPDDFTDAARKRVWRAEPRGQRQIELNRYVKAISKEIDSLKSRVYRLI